MKLTLFKRVINVKSGTRNQRNLFFKKGHQCHYPYLYQVNNLFCIFHICTLLDTKIILSSLVLDNPYSFTFKDYFSVVNYDY